jgi:hypothetical protein
LDLANPESATEGIRRPQPEWNGHGRTKQNREIEDMKTIKFAAMAFVAFALVAGVEAHAGTPIVYQTAFLPFFGFGSTPAGCPNGQCPVAVPAKTYYPAQTLYYGSVPQTYCPTGNCPNVGKSPASAPVYYVPRTVPGVNYVPGATYIAPAPAVRYNTAPIVVPSTGTPRVNVIPQPKPIVIPTYNPLPAGAGGSVKTAPGVVSTGRPSPFYP